MWPTERGVHFSQSMCEFAADVTWQITTWRRSHRRQGLAPRAILTRAARRHFIRDESSAAAPTMPTLCHKEPRTVRSVYKDLPPWRPCGGRREVRVRQPPSSARRMIRRRARVGISWSPLTSEAAQSSSPATSSTRSIVRAPGLAPAGRRSVPAPGARGQAALCPAAR